MKTTKLFDKNKVKKFFDILEKLDGSFPINKTKQIYRGYKKNNPNIVYSQRHVFVNRTINKWFKGKYLIIYKTSKLGITYKQYINISNIEYKNDESSTGYIKCYFIDYCDVFENILKIEKFKYSNVISLEGEWCLNSDKHDQLLSLLKMNDVPKKEYVFKAYDFNKYSPKIKNGINPKKSIETTISFKAKTEYEAFKLKKQYEEKCRKENNDIIVTEEILQIN